MTIRMAIRKTVSDTLMAYYLLLIVCGGRLCP